MGGSETLPINGIGKFNLESLCYYLFHSINHKYNTKILWMARTLAYQTDNKAVERVDVPSLGCLSCRGLEVAEISSPCNTNAHSPDYMRAASSRVDNKAYRCRTHP